MGNPTGPHANLLIARVPSRLLLRPDIAAVVAGTVRDLPPVDVIRSSDLVHVCVSFVNLTLVSGGPGAPPDLRIRTKGRPSFLIADFSSQHVGEHAVAEGELGLTLPADPRDPHPAAVDPIPEPPVFASLSGPSRVVLAFSGPIPFTTEGILRAISASDLNVAAQAAEPVERIFRLDTAMAAAAIERVTPTRRSAAARAAAAPTTVAGLVGLGRLRNTGALLEHRFGSAAAIRAAAATTTGRRIGIDDGPGRRVALPPPPPLPAKPADTETALELPWRLVLSPTNRGAFALSPTEVDHDGRVELWHARLGVRALDAKGKPALDADGEPLVDERDNVHRVVRAIWARDFDELAIRHPNFAFQSPPTDTPPQPPGAAGPPVRHLPSADGSEDDPPARMSLNSRDRMMLVHETANFRLDKSSGGRFVPPAVPVERLMLSALGGWLASDVHIDPRPNGVSIEEWKHRATMGRDHEVKVVYAGFLMPFGHKASLVKVTERRIDRSKGRPIAYLFQRFFVIVREPEKVFGNDPTELQAGGRTVRADFTMPFSSVRILTLITPTLHTPGAIDGDFLFVPTVDQGPFLFRLHTVDVEGNVAEFAAPLAFKESTADLVTAAKFYNGDLPGHVVPRDLDVAGQKIAYAESTAPDDTALATRTITFQAVIPPGPHTDDNVAGFVPVMERAGVVVPAMSALAGAATPVTFRYHDHYALQGFAANGAEVFLERSSNADASSHLSFTGQGDRSGGFVTPNLQVNGLSRITGPMGGDLQTAIDNPTQFKVADFFKGVSAKLFGIVPLEELFAALAGTTHVPTFVSQTLNAATALSTNAGQLLPVLSDPAIKSDTAVKDTAAGLTTFINHITDLASHLDNPPDLGADLTDLQGTLGACRTAVEGSSLPATQKHQAAAVIQRLHDQLDSGAAVQLAVDALKAFAGGGTLPEVLTARLDWSTKLDPWKGIFVPQGSDPRLALAVEVQAPTVPGKAPSTLVSCSLSPFDLRLVGSDPFLILHFGRFSFTALPGQKPDVDVLFDPDNGIEFAGPLRFVNALRDIIPSDGFSDPPYLDVDTKGLKAGFDLSIPDLAVGIFALTNISLGARLTVPFIDDSIEVAFNFCTRERPFRLQVALFAGGGFFGVTVTPGGVRVLEAAFEFGAAISINLGVASGGVSIMAGVYFRIEGDDATLTGYFRMRGEVSVLGLISASIELYLELTYETATNQAVGRATLTIEVEIFFFSFSVSLSFEKKFAGSNADPSFEEVMGADAALPGGVRPWDEYCGAFAND